MKTRLITVAAICCLIIGILSVVTGCMRIKAYQQHATEKCEEKHTPEECKPLPYPSCPDSSEGRTGCANQ